MKLKTSRYILVFAVFIILSIGLRTALSSIKTKPKTRDYGIYFYITSKDEREYLNRETVNTTTWIDSRMDLYACEEPLDIETLKTLCSIQKSQFKKGNMYYLTVFDSKANAEFPTNYFSSLYNGEPDKSRHIRAHYVYVKHNGYSRLTCYETNSWESLPTKYTIY
jgi:hypothetical protein